VGAVPASDGHVVKQAAALHRTSFRLVPDEVVPVVGS
jgi:hypothetical protein